MIKCSKNEDYIFEIIHDLKSPVLSIDFALKNIKRNEFLDEIYKINKHNLNYIEELLFEYSTERKKYCPKFEAVDLLKIIKEEIEVLNFLIIEKKLNIEIICGADCRVFIITDKAIARQIILNLLSNAVKHTDENETVKINFSNQKKYLNICFKNKYPKNINAVCSSKMGLEIIKKKIKIIKGKFKITKNKNEICFNVSFPYL